MIISDQEWAEVLEKVKKIYPELKLLSQEISRSTTKYDFLVSCKCDKPHIRKKNFENFVLYGVKTKEELSSGGEYHNYRIYIIENDYFLEFLKSNIWK